MPYPSNLILHFFQGLRMSRTTPKCATAKFMVARVGGNSKIAECQKFVHTPPDKAYKQNETEPSWGQMLSLDVSLELWLAIKDFRQ